MASSERWRNNWLAVAAPGAAQVDLGRPFTRRDHGARRVSELATGSPVVVRASAPGATRRCRRFATRAGIGVDRVYLAFPSATSPAYLVEDAAAPIRLFVSSVLVTPPRTPLSTPIEALLSLVRLVKPWRLVRAAAPGCVVVGTRT